MSIDERARHELHLAVEQAIGPDEAATLMELLPPVGWADVATKSDFEAQRAVFAAGMDGLRAEVRGGFTELRGEMALLRGEMAQLRGEFDARLADMTRLILLTVLGLMIATWSAMVALAASR